MPLAAIFALALAAVACTAESERPAASTPVASPTTERSPSPEAVEAMLEDLADQDWSTEDWFSTFGDPEVLLESSELELDRYFVAEDRLPRAIFRSEGGQPTLRVVADGQREVVDVDPSEYTELWQDLVDAGWVAFAMEGREADFHLGRETAEENLSFEGGAGPRGLGWSLNGTRQGFDAVPELRRAVERVAEEASEHSELYRQGVP